MKNVLLLEPNPKVASVICEFFTSNSDLNVLVAGDSQSALTVADSNKIDLAIIELAIAKNNGLAFLHEFTSYSDWSNIPVIVHSLLSLNEFSDMPKLGMLGVKKYLYKPKTKLQTLLNEAQELTVYEQEDRRSNNN